MDIQTIHFGFPTLSFSGLSFWFSHELRIEFEFCSLPGFFDIHMKQKSHLRTHEMLVVKGFPFQEWLHDATSCPLFTAHMALRWYFECMDEPSNSRLYTVYRPQITNHPHSHPSNIHHKQSICEDNFPSYMYHENCPKILLFFSSGYMNIMIMGFSPA